MQKNFQIFQLFIFCSMNALALISGYIFAINLIDMCIVMFCQQQQKGHMTRPQKGHMTRPCKGPP